jgi:hypothetical protein
MNTSVSYPVAQVFMDPRLREGDSNGSVTA